MIEWSDGAVIGFNAGSEHYENHALSGLLQSSVIDCVHTESEWNNVIFDLTPGEVMNTTTPIPPSIIGKTMCLTNWLCYVGIRGFCS